MSFTPTGSLHSHILDYLGGLKLPDGKRDIELDWSQDGPLSQVKNHWIPDHSFCPCECLVNDDRFGLEIQHHDGLYGTKNGAAGIAFGNALSNQADFYNNMQALVAPNLPPPVRAMIITKVGTFNLPRILQLWGSAQEGLARAICDAWENGWFPANADKTHVIVTGIFIHPYAGLVPPAEGGKFDKKNFLDGENMEQSMHAINGLTYLAGIGMLSDALTGGLTSDERVTRAKTTRHLFRGFKAAPVVTA